ncbi:TPA: hypothetical protein ACQJLZ_004920, partial [Citrobacter freundii]
LSRVGSTLHHSVGIKKINACLMIRSRSTIAASVWNTDLMQAVLVKQFSVQALSSDTLLHEPPP